MVFHKSYFRNTKASLSVIVCLVSVLGVLSIRSNSVMDADHESTNGNLNRSSIGNVKGSSFIFGICTVSLLAGFGLALGRVKRKNPTEFNELAANKLALKALGYGTILSVCGCGILVVAAKWALGVRNIDELSAKMKQNLPQKDGDFVQQFDSWKLPRKSDANDEQEWENALSK